MQLKLFRVFNRESTLPKIDSYFSDYLTVSDYTVGIPYDYGKNNYKKLLEVMKNMEVKQFIITPEKFFKLLNSSINEGYFLSDIQFLESVPAEHQELITHYKNNINSILNPFEKQSMATKLFSELDWLITDESIDIKKINIRINSDATPIQVDVEIYNNGVILLDDISVKEKVVNLLTGIE
ncbi:hypothetical protein [Ornithinibacillus halotolerans]|uniref:Uncharacterized protein n=1 Tax=Ornithinibacillus halotolerans TaxID=1274357 RepID=A0A916W5X2_9BACI|nr:hypothetical protein [Ornithinibacillus halotolerans]GGA69509.1 hypothetical protein GCM10008025_11830 [Ornithinibacillus halotolerans]